MQRAFCYLEGEQTKERKYCLNNRKIGAQFETVAAELLKQQGFHILEKNYRCKTGEIDLIAREGEYLVFIEVKYRKNARKGFAVDAVTREKQKKICRTADFYMRQHHMFGDMCIRFDVAAIDGKEIRIVKNAFPYVGAVRF